MDEDRFQVSQRVICEEMLWSVWHEGQGVDLICKDEKQAKHVCEFLNRQRVVVLACGDEEPEVAMDKDLRAELITMMQRLWEIAEDDVKGLPAGELIEKAADMIEESLTHRHDRVEEKPTVQ